MEKIVRKFSSFQEADAADREYRRSQTPAQRVELVCTLMERSKIFYDDPPDGLEKTLRIIPLSEH